MNSFLVAEILDLLCDVCQGYPATSSDMLENCPLEDQEASVCRAMMYFLDPHIPVLISFSHSDFQHVEIASELLRGLFWEWPDQCSLSFPLNITCPRSWSCFPGGTSGKEPTCQCRRQKRCEFDPWVRKIPWRREWQPTPVLLPGESRRQRDLAGFSPQGHKESDTTEATYRALTLRLQTLISPEHAV